MTKEEFKEMFEECFKLHVSVGWTSGKFPDYALKIKILDKETDEVIAEDCVATYQIKE